MALTRRHDDTVRSGAGSSILVTDPLLRVAVTVSNDAIGGSEQGANARMFRGGMACFFEPEDCLVGEPLLAGDEEFLRALVRCGSPVPGSVRGEGPKRSRRRAPEASPGYDKMPGARLVERQNDSARDFGVSWLSSACSHSQPTSHLSQK